MIFQTAQIDVTETVAIDIAQAETRSIESNLILGSSGIAQDVCEVNGRFAGRHKGKAGLASEWNTQRGTPAVRGGFPVQVHSERRCCHAKGRDPKAESKRPQSHNNNGMPMNPCERSGAFILPP
jgi:hypothetical protein